MSEKMSNKLKEDRHDTYNWQRFNFLKVEYLQKFKKKINKMGESNKLVGLVDIKSNIIQ